MMKKILGKVSRQVKGFRLPKTLLISTVSLAAEHKRAVLLENKIERDWYVGVPGYNNLAKILAATAVGRLVSVEGNSDYLPIMRLRNPKLLEMYPPYLTPYTKALLDEVGSRWRDAMNQEDFDPQIRLAVTSLIRTIPYQATIVRAGKLADPNSVHTRGEVFDLDASGYYVGDLPVNPRASLKADFASAFKEMKAEMSGPEFGDFATYKPRVHEILLEVITSMQADGKLHFAHEFPGTTNTVFHVCRNPEYLP